MLRQRVGLHGGGRHLDHDADPDLPARPISRADSLAGGAQRSSGTRGHHGEHDPAPAPPAAAAQDSAELGLAGGPAARSSSRSAADAEEGVGLDRQAEMRHLLVAADVERADDQRAAVQRLDHAAIGGVLVVLIGCVAALEEQEFGAHQPDAFGALGQGEGGLVRQVDVGRDLDAVAVARGRRFRPQRRLPRPLLLLRGDPAAGGAEIGLGRVEMQPPGAAIQHRRRARRQVEQPAPAGDQRRDAEGARQDGGMRGRPTGRRRQPDHLRRIEPGGIGGRQVVGHQDHRASGSSGQRRRRPARIDLPQHPAADIAQAPRAASTGAERRQRARHPFHRLVPGPGEAVALHHELAGDGDQVRVVQ